MQLNKIFASHMVFAAKKPIRIYGEGKGTAKISFAGTEKTVTSDAEQWLVEFPPMEYGGPYILEVVFEDSKITLEDIYIGEVYLFAGQSNMQFKMYESNTPEELYNSNSKLRLYSTDRIEKTDFYTPDDGWVLCEKEQVKNWSAITYLAGNEVSKIKDIAVGVIACYQGASVIESWVPEETFEKMNINIPIDKKTPDHTHEIFGKWNGNGTLYSYALSQVIPYSLSSVIWYQGESDASVEEGQVYAEELSTLINIWRKDFCDKHLPFVIVQIADCIERAGEGWSLVQNAQLKIQSMLSDVKTVISADVCETDDVHPPTKDKIAKRVADALIG